jgi:transcription elongation factor/antiterminator RfaH
MLASAEMFGVPGLFPEAAANGRRWYAVQCQPHRERGAAVHLANQDYDVFLPWRQKTRRHARRIEKVLRPFFPGYLFVRLDLARDRWRPVNGTFGVTRIVMQGERPAAAPRGMIETLMDCCNDDGVLAWEPALEPGQSVRVSEGPFADLIGELKDLDDSGRVCVLLNIMGGKVPTWLSRASVIPAASLL